MGFVKSGNSFLLINLHLLLGKLGARQHFIVYTDLQTNKNYFTKLRRNKQDSVCIRHVPQVIWHLFF